MVKGNFGFKVRFADGTEIEGECPDVHALKSANGKVFHLDKVASVVVFDETGEVELYLRKMPDGTVKREERKG